MVRTYSARVDVYRSGAKLKSLRCPAQSTQPSITASASNAIKTGLTGEFLFDPDVDYFNDDLRPTQIIDGVEHQVGVFHIARCSSSYTQFGRIMKIEAYDKAYLLKSTTTETILHLSAGVLYLDAIESLLVGAGISLAITTPNESVLSTDREDWPIGTDYLTIVNTLLAEINYQEIWFNESGYAVIRPNDDASAENIAHTYAGLDVKSILSHDCTSYVDMWDKPNVFIAICQNPDLPAPIIATAENDSPVSAISIYTRGRRIAKAYKVNNIADQAALQKYVNGLRDESMLANETLTIYTANVPGHGIWDTVAVQHPQVSGIYKEIGWEIMLAPGQLMRHELQRKVLA